ncbi:hypothetical protein PRBRB14_18290 [Hallella multisaccharivorax DSM 17128]|uniref:Uncharacterized protein n=1 Tax=Hallella multisaccharivorax DSM 17128 TaxID=688246 RepID=F8N9W9_9BACT|nr:hypothetical protein Premu_2411 [Hallella multisaccharivorax DSM 17128]GJG30950.1 hypothetical protein PRBRB14_18290 [Hallella multisaccharivorax DSM 17128]
MNNNITELTASEMRAQQGGSLFSDVYELFGYVAVWHARCLMYNNNAPSVLAYK